MKGVLIGTVLFLIMLVCPSANAQHSATLSWTASADAGANPTLTYNIFRSSTTCASATSFTQLNTAPITGTTYTDSTVTPGNYCYEATSVLNGVQSADSNTAQAVILPASPSSLVVTKSQ